MTYAAGMVTLVLLLLLLTWLQGLKLICVCLSVCVQVGVSGPRAKRKM